ncbi:MAG: APC family permease [candidate division Zixibacteria bacterium]|jgi:amino acid transporter|nr:APC family permease [candidate division Zixibacteria bacterium]
MTETESSTPLPEPDDQEPLGSRVKHVLFGKARDINEPSLFHKISLIPVLAWIGLGADGLSSSSYGPEEAFRALQGHTYLAFALAAATALTVIIISMSYSRIIEEFPHGGGGYLVASKLLGARTGVVSGSALLVDYILTIAVSIVAAGDALFSLLPMQWQFARLPLTASLIIILTILNIRGVRESVLALAPIFVLFLITHAVLIGSGIFMHVDNVPAIVDKAATGFGHGYSALGLVGMVAIFARAFSMGGGTYTGLEAVSNGLPVMREPRVHTAKRTMIYMATSLSITAAGLLICYLLWDINPEPGKTMNAVLAYNVAAHFPAGQLFVALTMFAAGALLVVGAQAGFIDGPRVLANMAVDSWVPRHFATLSERLTTQNGIVLMGVASLAVVVYTRGDIHSLVVMYSINVFLTFSLSMFGMLKLWITRHGSKTWKRHVVLFLIGFVLCASVLTITTYEKFSEGGWLTVVITGLFVVLCMIIRAHYRGVATRINKLNQDLSEIPTEPITGPRAEFDARLATAGVLVAGYGGLGVHTVLNVLQTFRGQFNNIVFLSVGVVDSGEMKGSEQIQLLKERTADSLKRYVELAERLGMPSAYRMSVGTDVVENAHSLCVDAAKEFPRITFFAGQLVFQHESWYTRLLHNQTAFSLQKRLIWDGQTLVVLPIRVR